MERNGGEGKGLEEKIGGRTSPKKKSDHGPGLVELVSSSSCMLNCLWLYCRWLSLVKLRTVMLRRRIYMSVRCQLLVRQDLDIGQFLLFTDN